MKDLSKFESVKNALEQVVSESDVNNGTTNVDFLCYYWDNEFMFDQKRQDIQVDMARKQLAGDIEAVKKLQKEFAALDKPKIMMEFRLVKPIPKLLGTKIISDGDKTYKITMENVTSLFIPEDAVKLGLLEYEDTTEIVKDARNNDTPIIKLRLKKGLIDVAAPIQDRFGRQIRPKRAIVTATSYRSMQIAGEMLSRERLAKRRRYGFDEQQ